MRLVWKEGGGGQPKKVTCRGLWVKCDSCKEILPRGVDRAGRV